MGMMTLILWLVVMHLFIPVAFPVIHVICNYESNGTPAECIDLDHCKWQIDLTACDTLQIHCIEDDMRQSVSFCNSSRQCGFNGIPDKLVGNMHCEIMKEENEMSKFECKLEMNAMHEELVCVNQTDCKWIPNQLFKNVSSFTCFPKLDVSKCIRQHSKWDLPDELKCTKTDGKRPNSSRIMDQHVTPCPAPEKSSGVEIATIVLVVLLFIMTVVIVVMVVLICRRQAGGNRSTRRKPARTRVEHTNLLTGSDPGGDRTHNPSSITEGPLNQRNDTDEHQRDSAPQDNRTPDDAELVQWHNSSYTGVTYRTPSERGGKEKLPLSWRDREEQSYRDSEQGPLNQRNDTDEHQRDAAQQDDQATDDAGPVNEPTQILHSSDGSQMSMRSGCNQPGGDGVEEEESIPNERSVLLQTEGQQVHYNAKMDR